MARIQAVLIDNREPAWMHSLKFGSALVSVMQLDMGDVQCVTDDNELLIIERKSPDDFLGSIKDGRIFQQVARMKELSTWCYVIITGLFSPGQNGKLISASRQTGWDLSSIEGAKLTLQELGCGVVHCQNDFAFGSTVEWIAKRDRSSVCIKPQRTANVYSEGEAMLAALPGIGWEKMQALLAEMTPAQALSYLTNPYSNGVHGIGPGIKSAVKKALKLSEDESIAILSNLDREWHSLEDK
jgi:ERCC4-type nuclease